MYSDFESEDYSEKSPDSKDTVYKVIGAPLIKLQPFAVVLERGFEKRRCKSCLCS